jgi:hypothetical protein
LHFILQDLIIVEEINVSFKGCNEEDTASSVFDLRRFARWESLHT